MTARELFVITTAGGLSDARMHAVEIAGDTVHVTPMNRVGEVMRIDAGTMTGRQVIEALQAAVSAPVYPMPGPPGNGDRHPRG